MNWSQEDAVPSDRSPGPPRIMGYLWDLPVSLQETQVPPDRLQPEPPAAAWSHLACVVHTDVFKKLISTLLFHTLLP